jgi:hypothetical protein
MINKNNLQNFINKYYLNGNVESVKWDIKDKLLSVKFTSQTREMIGEIKYDNFTLPDSSIGISNTTQLLKLLNITNGDLYLDYIKSGKTFTKLIINDNQFNVNYTLADLLTVPKTGTYNGSEEYDLTAELTIDTITALIKAKSALPESTTVLIKLITSLEGNFELELIFGGDIEYANKVSYMLKNVVVNNIVPDLNLSFNSDLLKEILSVNKDATKAKVFINAGGLIKLEFESTNTTCVYYIVKKDV